MGEYIVEALKILNTLREVVEERNKVGDFDLTSELSRIDNAISEIESLIDINQKLYRAWTDCLESYQSVINKQGSRK